MTSASLLANTTVYHQFSRLHALTEWWQWLLLLILCAVVVAYVVVTYYYDNRELSRPLRYLLLALRIGAFGGILFYFLDLEKRSERQLVKNSRALVLVDTSLSMGIQDQPAGRGTEQRRIDSVVDELRRGDLIEQLRGQHDVVVYRFDQADAPIEVASFQKTGGATRETADANVDTDASLRQARAVALIAGVIILFGVIAILASPFIVRQRTNEDGSWAVLVGVVALLMGLVVMAVANLRHPDISLLATLGFEEPTARDMVVHEATDVDQSPELEPSEVDWSGHLAPRGSETRLGDALRHLVNRERGGSIAGVVIVTDGGSNAGVDARDRVRAARDAGIPLYTVGLGGDKRPANVRVADLEAPSRVFPGDDFAINGYIQASGFEGRSVRVELTSRAPKQGEGENPETFEEDRRITLGADGEIIPVRFEVTPTQQGRRTYRLKVDAPPEDQDARDNSRVANVQIVDRKNNVLLMAGGPAREFRFLRNLLYRDPDTTLTVLLQSGQPGMAQEADELLFDFPETAEELYEFDCILAFDPDWRQLSLAQLQLLERWVAEEAGGLIAVAGPVHTPRWASRIRQDERFDMVKALYPVVFYSRGSATLGLGRFASETAWPLEFSSDGISAEFLWLEDDSLGSQEAWASFEGVYGYYAVKDPKPAARVFARFSDPNTSLDGDLPIYLAGHFYGAGRVFFQASGEMWRIRALDDGYFETYYTKLIRWTSQGRLLRDSSRGVLMVDKEKCLLGDDITVMATLTDAQHQPLTAESVTASLVHPDGRRTPLKLVRSAEAARPGSYSGQFTAVLEGDYRIELQPPHGADDELLTAEVASRIPALETERPERNDALLKELADKTGGAYYVGLNAAMNREGAGRAQVSSLIEPQDQVTYLPGTPDKDFERMLMTWLMGLICGVLCVEWLIRRLSRLA